MKRERTLPQIAYKLFIIIATLIWGLAFVVMKDAVDVLGPAWLIGVRFALTGIILGIIFFRHLKLAFTKPYLIYGTILGILNFLAFWIQTVGLAYTTPGKNAFLTATYVIFVPFIYWAIAKRRPKAANIVAAVLCVCGMGFVTLGTSDSGVGFGDLMTIVSAVFFGSHIVCVSRYCEGRDILSLTLIQFFVGGILGIVIGAFTEPFPTAAVFSADFLFNLAYIVIFASCIALVIQNIALAHVPPAQASLFLSLEAVFGVIFSIILYGEALTLRLVVGFALIFVSILISELIPLRKKNRKDSEVAEMDVLYREANSEDGDTDPSA
ncbi:MAG: DMT family transporter, partial [Eggerthellaceae bacterium]|nr:DMT family transporter [Eggerthellaceae bacterium]